MVLRSLLREWRERRDGTLEGPALDTGSATIGGQKSDLHWELVSTVSDTQSSGNGATVSLPVSEEYEFYKINYDFAHFDADGNVLLQAGGQTNAGNWFNSDEAGAELAVSGGMLLSDTGTTSGLTQGGEIMAITGDFAEQGLDHAYVANRTADKYAISGRFSQDELRDWSSVDFVPATGGFFSSIKAELYGRNRP